MQIEKDVYDEIVRDQAKQLVKDAHYLVDEQDHYDDPEDAFVDAVVDTLDAFEWFSKSEYGPAAYGAIIEHSETDPSRHMDLTTLVDPSEPEAVVRKFAYACFEADVIETAKEIS